ncbi:MAG: DUF1464 family protein [Candidatus Omnitrophica bacterium]|nr:DUF1464 family protein [Candidatus Omnitrophota bacterium]
MKILGIDPGTVSFDLCLLDGEEVTFEDNVPSRMVAERPAELASKCLGLKPDAVIAPSGYGLPNRYLKDLTPHDFFELTLVRESESVPVLDGMKKFFAIVKEANLDILFLPGIIHLPTVPVWRKYNKIDMGTADKMCIGALSVETVSKTKKTGYEHVGHIVVEMGGGYNALITIESGRIVNGIGGTLFPGPGFSNAGAMDGEVAYLLGGFPKTLLFEGGASSLARKEGVAIEELTEQKYPEAFKSFTEGVLAAVCSQQGVSNIREVYLSGRLTRYENFYQPISEALKRLGYRVERLPTLSHKSKAAAQGYAVVGNGLYGGGYRALVRHMQIDKAQGSVTDYVYWKERI